MPDIATIGSVLGSIKTATDLAKLLKDSELTLEKAEVKLKLAELISALADAKIELAEVRDELARKDEAISELQNSLNLKSKVVWDKPYYFTVDDDIKEGPFCQRCYDSDGKLIRLQGGKNGEWGCRSCKSSFRDSDYTPPTIRNATKRHFW